MLLRIYNLSIWEVEVGSGVQDYPQLYSSCKVNLGYMRPTRNISNQQGIERGWGEWKEREREQEKEVKKRNQINKFSDEITDIQQIAMKCRESLGNTLKTYIPKTQTI